MFHRWAAPVLVLALCAFTPKQAAGQQTQPPRGRSAGIRAASKNPFNPDIRIQFPVGDDNCKTDEQHVVSVRILNILAQQVAVPVLFGPAENSSVSISTALNGRPIANLALGCGTYIAYWDGNVRGSNREAASGVYIVQVFLDGKLSGTLRIFHAK